MARSRKTAETLDKSNQPSTALVTVPIATEPLKEDALTPEESLLLVHLESQIQTNIKDAKEALAEIHTKRLYRAFGTWEQYLKERWKEGYLSGQTPTFASHLFAQQRLQQLIADNNLDTVITQYDAKVLAPLEYHPEALVTVVKELEVERRKPGVKKVETQKQLREQMERCLAQPPEGALPWDVFRLMEEIDRLKLVIGGFRPDIPGQTDGEKRAFLKTLPKLIRDEGKMVESWCVRNHRDIMGDELLPLLQSIVDMGRKLEALKMWEEKKGKIERKRQEAENKGKPDLRTADEIEADEQRQEAEQREAEKRQEEEEEAAAEANKVEVSFTVHCQMDKDLFDLIRVDGCGLNCEFNCREGEFEVDGHPSDFKLVEKRKKKKKPKASAT